MPSIKFSKGKIVNPVADKLILVGSNEVEIQLESLSAVSAKQSMCLMFLSKHYLKNKENYGDPSEFIKYLNTNFTQVDINTNKGRIIGSEINTRFLNKLKKLAESLILIDLYDKGKIKIEY